MFKYILKRIMALLLTFLVIVVICFVLVRLLPNELPADKARAQTEFERRTALGYYKPLPEQLTIYLRHVFTEGDFGVSWKIDFMKDASEIIVNRLPPTLIVNVYSLLVSVPIGIGLGIYAALRKNRWQDHLVSTLVMLFISVPSYVYAFLVQYIFGYRLGWLPLVASSLYDAGGSWTTGIMIRSLILPVLALSFGTIAGLTRSTRAELTESLTSDYMLLARTKGLTKGQATTRHALKNAMVPVLPSIISSFIGILYGSLVIENIFSINGIGNLLVKSIELRDYDVFMATTMFYSLVSLASMIFIDLSYGFLDPRIRMGAR
ncbi:MAG: ABC transporter permease [Oscillospiraceae bacterium]|jgi:ABC-type dipeptide/oligopeptide/nickel transport system permease component|nr:ABC transporter permease [Oscillospiraceae bacterium]